MRRRALTVFLLSVVLLTACAGAATPTRIVAPAATATPASVAATPSTSPGAPISTAAIAATTPATSSFTLRLSVEDASFVNIDKHVPAVGQGNLLLRTTVANTGTKAQTIKAEYFRLRVDSQDLRFDQGATDAAEGPTNIHGFRSALGTRIDSGKAETRIIVFVVPLDAKQLILSLKKDDKSPQDVANPLPITAPAVQAAVGYATPTATPPATQKATIASASTATPRAAAAQATPTANPLDARHYDAFVTFMTENFGGPQGTYYRATWYDHILGYTVMGATAVARTDLGISSQDRETAQTICGAMTTYRTFGPETEWLRNVQLYSTGGVLLRQMKDAQLPCS